MFDGRKQASRPSGRDAAALHQVRQNLEFGGLSFRVVFTEMRGNSKALISLTMLSAVAPRFRVVFTEKGCNSKPLIFLRFLRATRASFRVVFTGVRGNSNPLISLEVFSALVA